MESAKDIAMMDLYMLNVWIYKTFVENKHLIDEYTFMRILTKGLDSILKN